MKTGDFLIYKTGERAQILAQASFKGKAMLQIEEPNIFMGSAPIWRTVVEVEKMIHLGIWKIEPGNVA